MWKLLALDEEAFFGQSFSSPKTFCNVKLLKQKLSFNGLILLLEILLKLRSAFRSYSDSKENFPSLHRLKLQIAAVKPVNFQIFWLIWYLVTVHHLVKKFLLKIYSAFQKLYLCIKSTITTWVVIFLQSW